MVQPDIDQLKSQLINTFFSVCVSECFWRVVKF
jgi:hypothetical protein